MQPRTSAALGGSTRSVSSRLSAHRGRHRTLRSTAPPGPTAGSAAGKRREACTRHTPAHDGEARICGRRCEAGARLLSPRPRRAPAGERASYCGACRGTHTSRDDGNQRRRFARQAVMDHDNELGPARRSLGADDGLGDGLLEAGRHSNPRAVSAGGAVGRRLLRWGLCGQFRFRLTLPAHAPELRTAPGLAAQGNEGCGSGAARRLASLSVLGSGGGRRPRTRHAEAPRRRPASRV